jgi:hypothetical protein
MPQCKAIKTFHSEQLSCYMRAGTRFSADKAYANALRSKGLIVILSEGPEPERVQSFDGAPLGKDPQPAPPPASRGITADSLASHTSADLEADGAEKPSVLSRVGQALRKPTAPTSKANAKR